MVSNLAQLANSSKSIRLQISLMCRDFKWLLTSKVNHKLDHCQIIWVLRQVIFRWDDNLVYWPGIAPSSQIYATINDLFQSRLWCWVLDLPPDLNGFLMDYCSRVKIWECGRLILGGVATTGPNTGIMSLPRGVRTCSIGNLLILFSGAPTCVWRHLTTTFHLPLQYLFIFD